MTYPLSSQPRYGYKRTVPLAYDKTVERARETLALQGFGVLCEIDIKDKLKEKLGVDFRRYVILGVCNPPLAYQTLQVELDIGLLLPCNVVVYEVDDSSVVAAIDARQMLAVVNNPQLERVAQEVDEKLRRAIDEI